MNVYSLLVASCPLMNKVDISFANKVFLVKPCIRPETFKAGLFAVGSPWRKL